MRVRTPILLLVAAAALTTLGFEVQMRKAHALESKPPPADDGV